MDSEMSGVVCRRDSPLSSMTPRGGQRLDWRVTLCQNLKSNVHLASLGVYPAEGVPETARRETPPPAVGGRPSRLSSTFPQM
jgi:hypothetical protein